MRDVGSARRVLVVDDNAGDVDLVREALRALPFSVQILDVSDGERALAALRESAQRGVLPDFVFLDLNLPSMTGHQVLAAMKGDPALREVPVVVLTSSSAELDSDAAHALDADDFVVKPLDVYDYFVTVQAAARIWLGDS